MEGFLVSDHFDLQPEFLAKLAPLVQSGDITYRETVRHGLDHAAQAFIDLLRGANTGKMLVKL
jgi:NADPH-dependent curcumin reductase CurA